MKKLVSIFTTLALTLSLLAVPAMADPTPTPTTGTTVTTPAPTVTPVPVINGNGISQKDKKAIEKNIEMVKKQIAKLQNDKIQIEKAIANAIQKLTDQNKKKDDKKKESEEHKTLSINEQIAKLNATLKAAQDKDAKELADLNNYINKLPAQYEVQKASLNKQLLTINSTLDTKVTELNKKIDATSDPTAKQALINTRTQLQNYAGQKIKAINDYIAALNLVLPQRIALLTQRRTVMIQRQKADMDYLTIMTGIKITELNDKLITAPTPIPTPTPVVDSAKVQQIRDKYAKQLDGITKKLTEYQKKLGELEAQLKALKK